MIFSQIDLSGEYLTSVKFNDEHIPDSPFKVHISPSVGDARKLTVQSLEEGNLQVCLPKYTEDSLYTLDKYYSFHVLK